MGCGKSPQLPDYGQMSRDAVLASLQTYPQNYLVNAAAQLGVPVNVNGQTFDFTGLGDASNAAVMSDQMAQAMLDIQRNYGPQYVQERLRELQAADPQGYAARKQLFDQILAQAQSQPDRPLASDLQNSINQQLANAGRLDPRMLQEAQQQARGSEVASGNFLGNAATEKEAGAVVNAAQNSQNAVQQSALGFLQSGISPEDVAYRRLQQSLGNLSNFVNGQSPVAQFQSLSGAQQGVVPFTASGNPAQLNMNAASQGAQNALQIYGGNINWAQSQANPWLAGLSTGANTLRTFANLGWSPGGSLGAWSPANASAEAAYWNPDNWAPVAGVGGGTDSTFAGY